MKTDLLLELFTEELPPGALQALGTTFAQTIAAELTAAGLADKSSEHAAYASPRRLAVHMAGVLDRAMARQEQKKLMPVKVGMDAAGKPTAALLKRLQKDGIRADTAHLERRTEGATEYVYLHQIVPGATLASALQAALEKAIASLPIPKMMTYQLADGTTTVSFVRPAHGLVALHGKDVVPVHALGLTAGRVTHGHRFQCTKHISLTDAIEYEHKLLTEGYVMAAFGARRAEIERQLREQAAALGGSLGPENDVLPLLDEVTALVEMPTVYAGEFEAEFLAVPQECLILTMRANQKYFPLFDQAGRLTNKFLIVSNMRIAPSEAGAKNIVEGNQRVVRPRLADARFFFETDKKTKLETRVPQLASVTYHNKLGNQLERVERVTKLAASIAKEMGADPALASRAAQLAKADLVTNMVGEFPELQGIMGRYYALADGEDPLVAAAIEQHYRPRFSGDLLPDNPIATALTLADKLETLVGIFCFVQKPTGDKDPFALRRHALGVIRILIEKQLPLELDRLISRTLRLFDPLLEKLTADEAMVVGGNTVELTKFFYERLASNFREQGYSAQEVEAVISKRPQQLSDISKRLAAVRAFTNLPEAESLAAANKRIANILRQAEGKGEEVRSIEVTTLKEPAENSLFTALKLASSNATPLFEAGDYSGYLQAFAVLKSPVDAFFDSVMVMAEDPVVRKNRLALLKDLREQMNRVADLSKLSG